MSQNNKTCQICGGLGHSKFYCKKRIQKPIKKTPIKKTVKPKKQKSDRSNAKDDAWG